MNVFYTFCRLIDDIADTEKLPAAGKSTLLNAWRNALRQPGEGQSTLAADLHSLMARYPIPADHLLEIIAGVEMDLAGREYETFEELRIYCHRVASVVGLVSIEIFGYRDPGCRQYALDLGIALQLTNIIRDVGVDLDNGGRVYLPAEDLARFGYTTADLRARRYDDRFRALLNFEAERAADFYGRARAALPAIDRQSMTAAEIMRSIYWRLLQKMRRDNFRVFQQRYRLGKVHKLGILLATTLRSRLGK